MVNNMSLENFMEIKRKNISFVDKHRMKRPLPPPGYIEFDYFHQSICPNCKAFNNSWVGIHHDIMYVDKEAQYYYESSKKLQEYIQEEFNEYVDYFSLNFQGDMIKSHWSKFSMMECAICKCKAWRDFVSGYSLGNDRYVNSKHYYLPSKYGVNLRKSYEKRFLWRLIADDGNLNTIAEWVINEHKFWKNKSNKPSITFDKIAVEFGVYVNSKDEIEVDENFPLKWGIVKEEIDGS